MSLTSQEKACVEFCNRQGFTVDKVFVEEGESAKSSDRAQLQAMLKYCIEFRGKIKFVVFYSVNRFSRETYDYQILKCTLKRLGISLKSATEPIGDTSHEVFTETMFAAVAQLDNDVRAQRTVVGMKAALAAGRWPFIPPIGYTKSLDGAGKSEIKQDSERSPLEKKAFELFGMGTYKKHQVLKMVTDLGLRTRRGKKVSPHTFAQILTNRFYTGWMFVEGWDEPKRGNFEPLVSQELFDKVQSLLNGRRIAVVPYTRNHPDFPLRHFVRCGCCSRPLTGSWSKGRGGKYGYYRCPNRTCKNVNVRREKFDTLFLNLVSTVQPKPEYIRLFHAIVLDSYKQKRAAHKERGEVLRRQLLKLQGQEDQVIKAFLYQRDIDKQTYESQRAKLNAEMAGCRMASNEAEFQEMDVDGLLFYGEHLLLNANRLWVEFPLTQKQRLQRVLFPSGLTFSAGEFGTPEINIAFKMLRDVEGEKTSMASATNPKLNWSSYRMSGTYLSLQY